MTVTKKRAGEKGNVSSRFITRSFSWCLLLVFAIFFVLTFVSALPSSLPIPLEAQNNASFFLKPNQGVQWGEGKDIFQISVQTLQADSALFNLYISGETMRFFISKGSTLNLDVTNDTKADGSITLVNIVGDTAELKMASFAGEQAVKQSSDAATTPSSTTQTGSASATSTPPTTPNSASTTPSSTTQTGSAIPTESPAQTTTPSTPGKQVPILQDNNKGTVVYGASIILIVIIIIIVGWIVWRRKPSS